MSYKAFKIHFTGFRHAYSFNIEYEVVNKEKWLADDNFFFDNPTIGDKYCFVTTLGDEAIGFLAWDPRNLPEYAIIGDNCIIPKHNGKGYGKLQLKEAINRITQNDVKKIFVSTDNDFIPAQRMYESVGFKRLEISTLEPWQVERNSDIYYGMEISAILDTFDYNEK